MPGDTPAGYDDTPFLPGQDWRVHDIDRPAPPVVETAAHAGDPPADAVVLFGGTDLSAWLGPEGDARWRVEHGEMLVVPGEGDIRSREEFGDCQLHIEWATPVAVSGSSQGRGNSGVFLMGRYEVQVLDSFENPTYADGSAAAIYGQYPPAVNVSKRPGEWQVYDIVFRAPRFDDGQVSEPAVMTVMHNGVVVHHARQLIGATVHREVGAYTAHGPEGPLVLQDHGDPVRYRNIWIRSL